MISRPTRSELEAAPREAVHVARNATKADVYRLEWPPASGQFAVWKDMKPRPAWFRLFAGRVFLWREYRALQALQGVEGVPQPIARPDADSILMEWRAGTPIMKWKAGTVSISSLNKIAQIIGEAHKRGVIHGDLHRSNVLLTDEGDVTIIDWATAGVFSKPMRGTKSFTFQEWEMLDLRSVAKLKVRHAPEQVSETERDLLLNGSQLYRLVRSFGFKIRWLFGHRKAKSLENAEVRYKQFMDRGKKGAEGGA